jgi:hypothetical protein
MEVRIVLLVRRVEPIGWRLTMRQLKREENFSATRYALTGTMQLITFLVVQPWLDFPSPRVIAVKNLVARWTYERCSVRVLGEGLGAGSNADASPGHDGDRSGIAVVRRVRRFAIDSSDSGIFRRGISVCGRLQPRWQG